MEQLSPENFESFRGLLYERTGISLRKGKESLLVNRVQKHMRRLELDRYADYLSLLKSGRYPKELVIFQDSLSTNLTSFFRENHHFVHLRQFLKKRAPEMKQPFRMWSAASSSGEEPYSAAMVAQELFGNVAQRCKILATDISTQVLRHGIQGTYELKNVEKMDPEMLQRSFVRKESNKFVVKKGIREAILFKCMNLSEKRLPLRPKQFDVVFCRNVMIYFDAPTRQRLLSEISRVLKDDGVVYLGHADTVSDIQHDLALIGNTIYEKQRA